MVVVERQLLLEGPIFHFHGNGRVESHKKKTSHAQCAVLQVFVLDDACLSYISLVKIQDLPTLMSVQHA